MAKSIKLFFLVFFLFLIPSLLTLPGYGIAWDEPNHFIRGQAYLWFFLTGEKSYESLPSYNELEARSNKNYHKRSFYQQDGFDYNWQIDNDGDHPVLNDIFASFTNYIFYQKLGVLSEVEAYHIFGVIASAFLVATVFLFGYQTFGPFHGLFSAMFVATYPLFWGESHFNVKDPPQAAFLTIAIYFIWKAFHKRQTKYILWSGVFAGIALSIKFNIVFAPLIIIPWLIFLLTREKKQRKFVFSKEFIFSSFWASVIALFIFFLHWPFLWQDILTNTQKVLSYYADIGLESNFVESVSAGRFNTYPILWISTTTPPLLLVFLFLGFLFLIKKVRGKSAVLLLWTFWLIIPIMRVVFPGTTIYGGIRQIIEFLPAMCLVAGFGATSAIELVGKKFSFLKSSKLSIITLLVVSSILILNLVRLHPNENVYFNCFIGGLSGAVEKGIPSAGSSFGNAYFQGMKWINANLPADSKLALVQVTSLNVPRFIPRADIDYSNDYWSGILRQGEYLMELNYNAEIVIYNYAQEYVKKFLEPLYEVEVDGVPILRVWKNDLEHTKPEMRLEEVIFREPIELSEYENTFQVDLGELVELSRFVVTYSQEKGCAPVIARVYVSQDGKDWYEEKDPISSPQISKVGGINENQMTYFFAARKARSIKLFANDKESCILRNPKVEILVLK